MSLEEDLLTQGFLLCLGISIRAKLLCTGSSMIHIFTERPYSHIKLIGRARLTPRFLSRTALLKKQIAVRRS